MHRSHSDKRQPFPQSSRRAIAQIGSDEQSGPAAPGGQGNRHFRRGGLLTVSVTAVAVIALVATVIVIAAASQTHSPSTRDVMSLKVRVCTTPAISCFGKGGIAYMKAMPQQIITSGEGSTLVNDIRWSNWGKATATGTGTLEIDDCKPNCARGVYTGYPATIRLSSLMPYSGAEAYSNMTVIAPTIPDETYNFRRGLVP